MKMGDTRPAFGTTNVPGAAAGPRPFALAATGVQVLLTGRDTGYQITTANLVDDADVTARDDRHAAVRGDYG